MSLFSVETKVLDSNENESSLVPEPVVDKESTIKTGVSVVKEGDKAEKQDESTEPPKMSKNAMKRLARLERVVQQRKETRKREREKRKKQGTSNLAVMVNADTGETSRVHRKALKKNLMSTSACKLRLVIDCSFEPLMSISDISHLAKQLAYSYGKNRRVQAPLQFYFTSMAGQTKEILDKSGLENWDIHRHDTHYLDVFSSVEKENIVYLTSDSSNVIEEFDDNKVYIIGGLVDHNHHKSHCYDLAVKAGISHAQLPIGNCF